MALGAITDAHDDVTPLTGGEVPRVVARAPHEKCNWVDPVETVDDRAARAAGLQLLYLCPRLACECSRERGSLNPPAPWLRRTSGRGDNGLFSGYPSATRLWPTEPSSPRCPLGGIPPHKGGSEPRSSLCYTCALWQRQDQFKLQGSTARPAWPWGPRRPRPQPCAPPGASRNAPLPRS